MQFTGLRIRHYKSLSDVYMARLDPITLLVGTNATGKSNIIDALRFLRDAAMYNLDHAVSMRGGIEIIRQYSPTRPYHISIRVDFGDARSEGEQHNGFYEVTISSTGGGNYRVEREDGSWFEDESGFDPDTTQPQGVQHIRYRTFVRGSDGRVLIDGSRSDKAPIDDLYVGRRVDLIAVKSLLTRPRFSAIYPNTLRSPTRPDTDRRLKETGENWASILKAMRHTVRGRNAVNSIIEMMRYVMPTLVDVRVQGVGGYLVPQFIVRDTEKGKEHAFDPLQLSDGTLRIFGMLMALYQVPPSQFLALEEPEQTVNPAILAMLADAFREVSVRTQLFVTTHSPHLIDFFEPDQIRVVTMSRGETHVSPVRASQIASVKERLTTLEELMAQGNLLPEET